MNEELKRTNISGQSLQQFHHLSFKILGVKDVEIVTHLAAEIKALKIKK